MIATNVIKIISPGWFQQKLHLVSALWKLMLSLECWWVLEVEWVCSALCQSPQY